MKNGYAKFMVSREALRSALNMPMYSEIVAVRAVDEYGIAALEVTAASHDLPLCEIADAPLIQPILHHKQITWDWNVSPLPEGPEGKE